MSSSAQQPIIEEEKPSKLKEFFLKSWQPVPTWGSTIIVFAVLGLILLGFGIAIAIINSNIIEVSGQYNQVCSTTGTSCSVTLNVNKDMTGPVFLYYELHNFYQNHRRYIKSKSTSQLAGSNLSVSDISSDCDPVYKNSQLYKTVAYDGQTTLNPDGPANPCGLIARSFFNDTFTLYNGSSQITITETGIAWPSDIGSKYKNGPGSWQTYQWMDLTNEHFIVWMRTAGLPDFRKLWGRIDGTITKGTYTVNIVNNYDVTGFQGSKYVVLSTTGPFGGKNSFMAIAYLVVGGICILISIFFFIRWRIYKQKQN